jgi:Methyltransferase FkbM domain
MQEPKLQGVCRRLPCVPYPADGMEGLVSEAPMTALLRRRGVFDRNPFILIDVGCAGGIDESWRAFGPTLIAHGYDPDISACEEAQSREPFPGVRYHPRFIGLPDSHPFVRQRQIDAAAWPDRNIWGRITAGYLAARERERPGAPQTQARPLADPSTTIGVAEAVRDEGLASVDFLKIDVDGPDLEVLESAREILSSAKVLGVGLEVNWFGTPNPTEHTFRNTDLLMRQEGYTLFGITFRTYSRTDLPAPFELECFAQTRFGQPYQGDAIYVRDLTAPYHSDYADAYPPEKLLKLACLFELIGLPDCAAEVLNRFEDRLDAFGARDPLLDALTPPLLGEELTYREYIARFENEPQLFLPSAGSAVSRLAVAARTKAQGGGRFWSFARRVKRALAASR